MAAERLDIFRVLAALNTKDTEFYASLTKEEQKAFQAYVVFRWFSSPADSSGLSGFNVVALNELINPIFWSLGNHPELQYKIMAMVGNGKNVKHEWVGAKKDSSPSAIFAVYQEWFPHLSDKEIKQLIMVTPVERFVDLMTEYGMDDARIKKLKKAFSDYKR